MKMKIQQNMWNIKKSYTKRYFRGKSIPMSADIKKSERSLNKLINLINDPMMHLKVLEKHQQAKPNISR
jgi:hypothetical protein